MKKIYIIFLCGFLGMNTPALFAQTKAELGEANMVNLLTTSTRLMFQGKTQSALVGMNKLADSLKIAARVDPNAEKSYFSVLATEAMLYQSSGNFSKAEELLTQTLDYLKNTKDPDKKETRKRVLGQLSDLYEKMGRVEENADNDQKNERVLEELVIEEYAIFKSTKGEAADFYDFYKKTYFNGMNISASDSLELLQKIEPYLKEKTQTAAEPGSEAYGMNMMIQAFRAINQQQLAQRAPTGDYVNLLKTGKFKFRPGKFGISTVDSWEEVRRLAALYMKMGNYVAAEALIKQAIANNDKFGNTANPMGDYTAQAIKMSLGAFGNVQGMQHATETIQQMMDANAEHNGTDINYIKNKVLLAQLYHRTGKVTAYKLLADTIASLCEKMNDVTNPAMANSVADAYAAIGRYKEAAGTYQKVTEHWKKMGSALLPMQLNTFRELAKAEQVVGNTAGAETALKQALAIYKESKWESYPGYIDIVIALAKLYENTDRYTLAEQYCSAILGSYFNNIRDNFGFLTEQEKLTWLNNQISTLDFSASLLRADRHLSEEFVQQIYNQQLQLKGLVLTDQEKVFDLVRKHGTPQVKKLFVQWQSNKSAIAWQYTQPATKIVTQAIDSLTTIANNQEKEINKLSGELNQLRQNQQIDFKLIQRKLGSGEAAIEFVRFNYYRKAWTDSVWYAAFVIRPGDSSPRFVPLFEERQLARLLKGDVASREFVNVLYTKGVSSLSGGSSLYSLIFSPLQSLLKGVEKLDIAPVGLLNNISFKALPANGGYLTDLYKEIRLYNSTREIAEQKQNTDPRIVTAVLYGGIKYGTADNTIPDNEKTKYTGKVWSSLNTITEVTLIDSLFKANKLLSNAITNYNATEESLKKLSGNSPGILHIATHGFSAAATEKGQSANLIQRGTQFTMAADPMLRNGIIMANGNKVWSGGLPVEGKDDGILTSYEIANLDLSNTQLVVLSACETALGDIKGTEGTFGLQRAFKIAGVKNMLLSLWDLPDTETVQFMKEFYANKINKSMPDYEALKSVQDEFRKTKPPFFWAGFILME